MKYVKNILPTFLTLLLCGVGFFSNAQLEGASRLANFGNRMHWDKISFITEGSDLIDSEFFRNTTISDNNGQLKYFSNGVFLFNEKNEKIKLNFNGNESNECLLFKLDTCYVLIIVDLPYQSGGYLHYANSKPSPRELTKLKFYYLSEYSSDLNSAIIDSLELQVPFAPFIEAVKHANSKDYWILFLQDTKELNDSLSYPSFSPHFYRIARLNGNGKFELGEKYPTFYHSYQGNEFYRVYDSTSRFYNNISVRSVNSFYGKFAPSGNYLVVSEIVNVGWNHQITTILKFNNLTGNLEHHNWIRDHFKRVNYGTSSDYQIQSKIQEDVVKSLEYFDLPDYPSPPYEGTLVNFDTRIKRFSYTEILFFNLWGFSQNKNFEISANDQLIFLNSCYSNLRADSIHKKWFLWNNDIEQYKCEKELDSRLTWRFSALMSYDLSLKNGTYEDVKLINPNAFLYYERCFNRDNDHILKYNSQGNSRKSQINSESGGGAFYDMQLMPDGAIYLINSDKFGGLSKLHTLGDSMWVEWIKDGSPQGFQGDAFSKVVSSYKLPGIKVLYPTNSVVCEERGVPLTAKVIGGDSVQWNTGAKGFSILAQEEGWYVASANTWYGVVKDSVYIKNAADFLRIEDVVKCPESEIKLNPKGNFLRHQLFTLEGQKRESIVDSGIYYMAYTFDGCIKYDTFEVSHHQWPEMVISQIDTGCIITEKILFMIAPDSFEYRWNGTLVSPPFYTQEFENVLEVVSHEGCKKTFAIRPESVCNTSYFIPNAFTPNDDGLNDVWRPIGEGIHEYKYEIFNRWGEKLMESGVNEEFIGNGYPVGVYVFLIELKLKDGTIVYEQATVFLGR